MICEKKCVIIIRTGGERDIRLLYIDRKMANKDFVSNWDAQKYWPRHIKIKSENMLIDILFTANIKFFEEKLKMIWLIRLKKLKHRHADVYFSYFPKSTKVFAQVYKVD